MKKLFFLMALVLSYSVSAQYYYDRSKNPDKSIVEKSGSDYDYYYFFSWDANNPLSNQNYISQTSTLGTRLGFRKRLNSIDRLWAGADLGWVVYKEHEPFRTYTYGNYSISTETFNYSYNYSLTANLDYFFTPMEKIITPYSGLGIGVAYDKFTQYYNIYGLTTSSFGVQIRPEIGVLIGFKENSSWRVKLGFHYDYASNTGKLVENNFVTPGDDNYKNFVNMGFQIGVVKMAW